VSRVYLDHNSTTPLRPEARERWLEVQDELGGNPSSVHASGRRARARVDGAREAVAAALGVDEEGIIFTSGGTESNNLALLGGAQALGPSARVVTSAVEHSSVLEPWRAMRAEGRTGALLTVDQAGHPDPEALERALAGEEPALVSLQAANNEVGTVPDLGTLVARARAATRARVLVHSDAVQALGRLDLRPRELDLDLVSLSAHKVGGPVGVGVLWRRPGTPLAPRTFGGGQELGQRPGTEDVAGIAAAARAIELAVEERERFAARVRRLRDGLWHDLCSALPDLRLVGPDAGDERRLPNTLCLLFPGAEGKVLVTRLDLEGLEVSAGSACASGSVEPSHVLLALGHDDEAARSGVRLSLGRSTSQDECKRAVDILKKVFAPSRAT